MPAFNSEKTIRHAAGSILAQSWRNLELIIVDDASSDNTSIIAHELAASDARVKVLFNPKNVGPYVSKNRALTFASGDFITGQDADDWALPYRIERQAGALLGNADLDAVIGYMLRMSIDGKVLQPTRIGRMSFDGVNRLASISLFMRAGVLRNKLGFWDTVKFGADSEFIARADLLLGKRFRNERQVTMFCLDHEDSLTNHTEFGINRVTGVEGIRQDYRKSWVAWQKNLKAGDVYLPFPQAERRFPAPAEMLVPQSDISESN
jgi:glycosyltransferase involved in cell wall biosynthesis